MSRESPRHPRLKTKHFLNGFEVIEYFFRQSLYIYVIVNGVLATSSL